MSECCTLCQRLIDKTPVRIESGPVCHACYQREFKGVSCATCGCSTRSLQGAVPAYCRRCRERTKEHCVRCQKAVGKNSFLTADGKVCAYCRRFFEAPKSCPSCGLMTRHFEANRSLFGELRVCLRCARSTHETCAICRKHRRVSFRRDDGRSVCLHCRGDAPYQCANCGQPGQRHSAAECTACYLRRATCNEAALLSEFVPRPWARRLFEVFAEDWICAGTLTGESRKRLRRYARFFVKLSDSFSSAETVTPEKLIELMGVEGLRRVHVPYAWLVTHAGLPSVSAESSGHYAEVQSQDRLLTREMVAWKAELLERFRKHLSRKKSAWNRRGWVGDRERFYERTMTLALRAAWRFLDSLGADVHATQGIDAGALELFVVQLPGHRNSLHAFVEYLNRKEILFQPLHIDRRGPRSFPFHELLSPARASELTKTWLRTSEGSPRNALLGLFMLLYARTSAQACSLRKGLFDVTPEGPVMAKFGPVPVALEPPIANLLIRHIAMVEAERGAPLSADDYLFPGQLPGRSFSPAGLQYVLKVQGVRANQLYTTAIVSFFRAGLRSPKVLVRSLGISDMTAVKYWEAFSPRIRDELKHRPDV